MATAQIRSTVSSTSITGSRDDVSIGNVVSLQHTGSATTYLWEFISKPPTSTATFSPNASNATPSFTPDQIGSYLVKLTIDGDTDGADTRVIAVKTTNLGMRIPASGETNEYDNNPSGIDGWSEAVYNGIIAIDTGAGLILKKDGTNSPTANINFNSHKITNLSAPTNPNDSARFQDIPATLSALNTKLGTTIDQSTDTRTPSSHSLGGAQHSATTLATLNGLISDANLDDAGDPRDPNDHATTHEDGGSDELIVQNLSSGNADAGYTIESDGAGGWTLTELEGGGGTDTKELLVSANDTTAGFLEGKTAGGLNISLSVLNDGANEDLQIATTNIIGLPEQGSDPSLVANRGIVYSKEVGGITELFYLDDAGTATQITEDGAVSGGGVLSSNGIIVTTDTLTSDTAINGTSFVQVFSVAITAIQDEKVLINFIGSMLEDANSDCYARILIDGTEIRRVFESLTFSRNLSFSTTSQALSAGSHTITAEVQTTAGSATLYADIGGTLNDTMARLEVIQFRGGYSTTGVSIISATKNSDQIIGASTTVTTVITDLSITFTVGAEGIAEVKWLIETAGDATLHTRQLSLRIDGGAWLSISGTTKQYWHQFAGEYIYPALSAGSHTVDFGHKSDTVGVTIMGGGTALFDQSPKSYAWVKTY